MKTFREWWNAQGPMEYRMDYRTAEITYNAAQEQGAPAVQSGEAPRQQLKPKMPSYIEIFKELGLPRDCSDSSADERKGAMKMYEYFARHFGH